MLQCEAHHLAGLQVTLEAEMFQNTGPVAGHETIGQGIVQAQVGNGHPVRRYVQRLPIRIIEDAADEFPVARMAFQNHDLPGAGGQPVVYFRVGKLHQAGAVQLFASPLSPARAEPEHFGKNRDQMQVKALVDFPDFLIAFLREATAQVHHHHI